MPHRLHGSSSSAQWETLAGLTRRFQRKLERASTPAERAPVVARWAQTYVEAGRLPEATELLEAEALRLGERLRGGFFRRLRSTPSNAPPTIAANEPPPEEKARLTAAREILGLLARVLLAAGQLDRALEVRQRAIAAGARLGPDVALAELLSHQAVARAAGHQVAAAAANRAAVRTVVARLAEARPLEALRVRVIEVEVALALGDVTGAAEQGATLVSDTGFSELSAIDRAGGCLATAWALLVLGRTRGAADLAWQARSAVRPVSGDTSPDRLDKQDVCDEISAQAGAVFGLCKVVSGEAEQGRREITRAGATLPPNARHWSRSAVRLAAAEAALSLGETETARSLAAEVRQRHPSSQTLLGALPSLVEAEACLADIRREGAQRLPVCTAAELLKRGEELVEAILPHVVAGSVLEVRARRLRALLAAERGEEKPALASLQSALDTARTLRAPRETCRCLVGLVRLGLRRSAPPPLDLLDAAVEAAAAGGDQLVRAEIRELRLLSSHGSQPATVAQTDRELRAMLEIGRLVSSILELDPLLERILDLLLETLHAERAFVVLFEPPRPLTKEPDRALNAGADAFETSGGGTGLRVRVARNLSSTRIAEPDFEISRTIVANVVRTGQAVLVSDASSDGRFQSQVSVVQLHLQSVLCFPLKTTRTFYGVLYLDHRSATRRFEPYHVELVLPFAAQAAVAIENALAYRKIRELYDETLSVSRARERIVNHISHELRTPIALIRGSLHQLRRRLADDSGAKRSGEIADRNLSRLEGLQRAMAAIYEEGGSHANEESVGLRTPVKAGAFLEETSAAARKDASNREVVLSVRVEGTPSFLAPPEAVRTALAGLLRNAVENTPDEGDVELTARQTEDGRVELVVRDRGIGLTAESRRHVFAGFYHTCETKSYSTGRPWRFGAGGKGLDLLLLSVRAQRLNWELELTSERCRFLPSESDVCPGRISACKHCHDRDVCLGSGWTAVRLSLPAV